MDLANNRRRALISWIFVGALFALCGVLGVVQYRWIGDVAVADGDRLRSSLQASLNRVSRDFNAELTSACLALLPGRSQPASDNPELDYAARYMQWKRNTRHGQMFRRIALAIPEDAKVTLVALDLDRGTFAPADWPAEWSGLRERIESRINPESWPNRRPGSFLEQDQLVFELPHFAPPPMGFPARGRFERGPGEPGRFGPPGPFERRETEWLIVEFSLDYVRSTLIPQLLTRNLGAEGKLDYQFEIVSKRDPKLVIYRSDPKQTESIAAHADASVSLQELRFDQLFRRFGPGGGDRERGPGFGAGGGGPEPRRGPGPDAGRWQMYARHRAGSLDAVVSHARWRNLAVTTAILLLMLVTAVALMRFTRHAQRLAELQMSFVAGVSHELRTPLAVIYTAAYNLRDGVARNPSQVERYGALIQQESERLRKLVEQVLGFANANAGRVIGTPEPTDVEAIIDDALAALRTDIESVRCTIETKVDPGLPLVMADPLALKHAMLNLLGNALKYGTEGSNWIGVFASQSGEGVEIRVADRGPGIPDDEQEHIFDPFFRGRQAVRDQVHGTGLGLNLTKKIVEAHGGSIRVRSELMKGTEFIIYIPAAPAEKQDEFTNSTSRG